MTANDAHALNGQAASSLSNSSSHETPRTSPWLEALARELIRFRLPLLFVGHTVVFVVSYWLAFCLRFDFDVPPGYAQKFSTSLPIVLGVQLAVFSAMRTFHGWWRYVTFTDLASMARALLVAFVFIVLIERFLLPFQIPRTVLVLDTICAGILLGLARSSWRIAREGLWPGVRLAKNCQPVLMISNKHETVMLAHQINSMPSQRHRVIGLLCDEKQLIGSSRAGIPIVGTPEQAKLVAARFAASEIWTVAGGIPGTRLRALKDTMVGSELKIKILPRTISGSVGNGDIPIRDIDIRDLLQREPIELDTENLSRQIRGRRIMVTGAGGSIGSEICRQLLQFSPSELVLVDHRENSVFLIHQELTNQAASNTGNNTARDRTDKAGDTVFHPCVGDVLDEPRMRELFTEHTPELVYHAAAHKHVGLMECNAGQAIKNNIFGTKVVADLAGEFAANKFVLISTDKAVNPTSVMGATKQIAERYVSSLAQRESENPAGTCFVVVRFGNVLGSNGSVVPIFKEQIAKGGPITVTDERMTRFFMTIPEASQLVLQAASMGQGGEIFVLEMGEQVPIIDLAREMIRLAGLPPNAIDIQITGVRPGEKLFEELYFDNESMLDTTHSKVHAAYHRDYTVSEVLEAIDSLRPYIGRSNADVRDKLKEIVPEFNWNPGGLAAIAAN